MTTQTMSEFFEKEFRNADGSLRNGTATGKIVHATKVGRYMGRVVPLQACRSRQGLSQHSYWATDAAITCKRCAG